MTQAEADESLAACVRGGPGADLLADWLAGAADPARVAAAALPDGAVLTALPTLSAALAATQRPAAA